MVYAAGKAVSGGTALISQRKQIVKGRAGLLFLMEKFRGKRNVRKPSHNLIGAYGNRMEAVHRLE